MPRKRERPWFKSVVCCVTLANLVLAVAASAQSTPIHQQILQTYNFHPHVLTSQEISQKSLILDQFWRAAKAQPSVYIPALRRELADFNNPPFFLYDGSMLLLSLSDTAADRSIALAAIARCDLQDVQLRDYFLQVHRMAALNENTTATALHILEDPKAKVFIPQHSLTLGQDYALVYMLMPTDQDFWLQPAIDRLRGEKDETAQKSLILLLWYAQTDAADKAVSTFAADQSKPAGPRDFAQEVMHRKDEIGAKQREAASTLTETALRQKRQAALQSVSDEALNEMNEYTLVLLAKRK